MSRQLYVQAGEPHVASTNTVNCRKQARKLEREGTVKRTVYPLVAPKVEYNTTDYGKTLAPILEAICAWGTKLQTAPEQRVKINKAGITTTLFT
ncbi:winged helix-turn-helix transcriptional regulator [Agaribacterium haliotis]|uniref:winged helix-turn-helix transcriptional regulator n=1 Tax=Agaribacterium haliotis TaxID=2013869 RepID=UPI0039C86064